jgi:hypothetical protein
MNNRLFELGMPELDGICFYAYVKYTGLATTLFGWRHLAIVIDVISIVDMNIDDYEGLE